MCRAERPHGAAVRVVALVVGGRATRAEEDGRPRRRVLGHQVVPGSGGGGIAAEKNGTVFEASFIDPPDEDPFIVIRVYDADTG